jgi:hypothetical protein
VFFFSNGKQGHIVEEEEEDQKSMPEYIILVQIKGRRKNWEIDRWMDGQMCGRGLLEAAWKNLRYSFGLRKRGPRWITSM